MFGDRRKALELLMCLVRRDLIVRYQSSVLGFFWSFAKPLALVGIFTLAFRVILKVRLPNENVPFALHMLLGVVVWAYFSRALSEAHFSVLGHGSLIKKVKLPTAVFPAATVVGNLINFLLGMVVVLPVVFIAMARSGVVEWHLVPFQMALFLFVTFILSLLIYGLALIVSAANVFYRDMEPITEVALQAWFYATPIVYPISYLYDRDFTVGGVALGGLLKTLYWLNPMTPVCVAYRRILLYRGTLEAPDGDLLLYLGAMALVSVSILLAGAAFFRRASRTFADEV